MTHAIVLLPLYLGLLGDVEMVDASSSEAAAGIRLQYMLHAVVLLPLYLGLLGDVEVVDAPPSKASSRNPVAPVAADIVVLQQSLKPVCPQPPVKTHVQGQVAGHVLPPSVGHEACIAQDAGSGRVTPCPGR